MSKQHSFNAIDRVIHGGSCFTHGRYCRPHFISRHEVFDFSGRMGFRLKYTDLM